eukprot:9493392-Alexandrium_andersonii.AAC.1
MGVGAGRRPEVRKVLELEERITGPAAARHAAARAESPRKHAEAHTRTRQPAPHPCLHCDRSCPARRRPPLLDEARVGLPPTSAAAAPENRSKLTGLGRALIVLVHPEGAAEAREAQGKGALETSAATPAAIVPGRRCRRGRRRQEEGKVQHLAGRSRQEGMIQPLRHRATEGRLQGHAPNTPRRTHHCRHHCRCPHRHHGRRHHQHADHDERRDRGGRRRRRQTGGSNTSGVPTAAMRG